MDINITRAIVYAVQQGALEEVEYDQDVRFHVLIPRHCPDVPAEILQPRNTWQDKGSYEQRASKLAAEFSAHFDKAYSDKNIDVTIVQQCPGK